MHAALRTPNGLLSGRLAPSSLAGHLAGGATIHSTAPPSASRFAARARSLNSTVLSGGRAATPGRAKVAVAAPWPPTLLGGVPEHVYSRVQAPFALCIAVCGVFGDGS